MSFESIQVGDGIQQSGYGDFDSDGRCHGWWNWDKFDQNTQSVERMSVLYENGKQKEARFDLDVSKKNLSLYFVGKKVIDDHQAIFEVGYPVRLGLWRGYSLGRLCYIDMHNGYTPLEVSLDFRFKFENEKWYLKLWFLDKDSGGRVLQTVECEESDLPPENCWDDSWKPSKKLIKRVKYEYKKMMECDDTDNEDTNELI